MEKLSPQKQTEIIDALRRGTVPQRGLDVFAVGLDKYKSIIDEELSNVGAGGAGFKAIRGEYGTGKTFLARWIQEHAKRSGFAASEVQISETETPLHKLETVYRRAMERLSTPDIAQGALRSIIDGWFYGLEEEALAQNPGLSEKQLAEETEKLLDQRLSHVSKGTPQFATALRGYRKALLSGDTQAAEGLIGWIGGQPHVGANIKRTANLKGEVDHFSSMSFLQGLLSILRDSGLPGLVLVLDEIETIQRVRGDVREKSLNALRQLLDEIDAGRFPGLYLVLTGTPAFFDGPQGVRRLEPLAQRLHVDFSIESRFDNLRAPQIRLFGFDTERLLQVGKRIRDIYATGRESQARIESHCDDSFLSGLATSVTGQLGGKVGIAPRLFLKKLVSDVLDRVDQYSDFNPRDHLKIKISEQEMSSVEKAASGINVDDIELDL
jgi:hypothetical protein